VEPEARVAITRRGARLSYDWLVLALGAEQAPDSSGALVYRDWRDAPNYRLLLQRARERSIRSIAFVRPAGASWPMPLYELALLTAAELQPYEVAVRLVTPEAAPLDCFGHRAGDEVRRVLSRRGVTFYPNAYVARARAGELEISPGHRRLAADRTVTVPRLVRHPIPGVPRLPDCFVPTDQYSRVRGLDRVLAVGDLTSFPVKQAGLAAQQADTAAAWIAACVGVAIEPRPFQPVLRGRLTTGRRQLFLHCDISGRHGDEDAVSWTPPPGPPWTEVGHHLGAYLTRLDRPGRGASERPPTPRRESPSPLPRAPVGNTRHQRDRRFDRRPPVTATPLA
jgi:sulfide:quinone oxidoreductase